MNNTNQNFEKIKADLELRPLFFDLIGKSFCVGLSDQFKVAELERIRFQREYYNSILDLTKLIESKINSEEALTIVQAVTMFYLRGIGEFTLADFN